LQQFIKDSERQSWCLKLISPYFQSALSDITYVTTLLETIPLNQQVLIGGTLGLTGTEVGFITLYQDLVVVYFMCKLYKIDSKNDKQLSVIKEALLPLRNLLQNPDKNHQSESSTYDLIPFHPVLTRMLLDLITPIDLECSSSFQSKQSLFDPLKALTTW